MISCSAAVQTALAATILFCIGGGAGAGVTAGDISVNTTELRVGGPLKLEAIGFLEMGRQRKAATSTTTFADDLDAAIPR